MVLWKLGVSFFCLLCCVAEIQAEVVYTIPPHDFVSKMTVSGCFCTQDNKVLLLLRNANRSCGNTWCLPAGKIERSESPVAAAIRNLKKQTGIVLQQNQLSWFKKFYIRLPEKDFELYLFTVELPKNTTIQLDRTEYAAFVWDSLEETLQLPLIPGADTYIKLLFEEKKER